MSGAGSGTAFPLVPARVRQWPRVFASTADEPRSRRASDVTLLAATLVGLVAISAAALPPPGFARAGERMLAALPNFLDAVWQVATDVLAVFALVLLVTAVARRRMSILRDLLIAAVLALLAWLLVGRVVVGSWPDTWAALRAAEPPPWYPALRIALPAAVVVTASPHMSLPLRRLGRRLTGTAAVGLVALGATTVLGATAGLLLALAVGAIVHLAFGSSAGRPGLGLVEDALAQLGVHARSLRVAEEQEAGLFLVHGVDDGGPLVVKVYGRDAQDSALLKTLWRLTWYRDAGAPLRVGRLQQVEHEAFVTLLAKQSGINTDTVVTAGATAEDDALLVLRRAGQPLDGAAAGDTTVRQLWELVASLHATGIAHGRVDEHHVVVDDRGALGIRDFRGSTAVGTVAHRHTDQVQALVTSVQLVGQERAIALAREAIGDDDVAAMLPFLQRAVLSPRQQRRVTSKELDLAELRRATAAALDLEPPKLLELRRVSPASIVRVVLPAIAAFALLSMLAGLDLRDLLDRLADAKWWLIALGVIVAQLPRITQAISTIGASPVPLPLGPVYALQLAVSYVNIAIPTAAARIAVNIRFFQRHGMAPGTALASGALDGFSGFIVQTAALVALLLFTPASLDLRLSEAVDRGAALLAVVGIIVGVVVLIIASVRRLRRFLLGWARRLTTEAREALRGLRSPRRLAMLFGGNLATEILFASALGVFVAALGYPVGIGELLLINISVALLSGLIPIPGGVGVAEGGLTFGLVQAGVPEEAAFAAVLLYRLASFYTPPIWGYVAMRWLERNEHL